MLVLRMIDVLLVFALLGAGYAVPLPMAPSPDVLAETKYVRLPQEDSQEDLARVIQLKELFRTEGAAATASNALHHAQLEVQNKAATIWDKLKSLLWSEDHESVGYTRLNDQEP